MTIQFRQPPTYGEPLLHPKTQNTGTSWYRWFQQIELGTPPASEVSVTVGASPFIYTAPRQGFMIVNGGAVTIIFFSRTSGTFYNTGQIAGTFSMSQGDVLKVMYTVAPQMTFVPS
jgi:hypothetical protein